MKITNGKNGTEEVTTISIDKKLYEELKKLKNIFSNMIHETISYELVIKFLIDFYKNKISEEIGKQIELEENRLKQALKKMEMKH